VVNLLSYPFRLDARGSVATTEDGEDYFAEEIASLISTRPGERTLVPNYGITDPVFNSLSKTELIEKIGMFGPSVTINSIRSTLLNDTQVKVDINYFANDAADSSAFTDDLSYTEEMYDANDFSSANTFDDNYYDATEGN
jgi:phage baseplate assembly protein W